MRRSGQNLAAGRAAVVGQQVRCHGAFRRTLRVAISEDVGQRNATTFSSRAGTPRSTVPSTPGFPAQDHVDHSEGCTSPSFHCSGSYFASRRCRPQPVLVPCLFPRCHGDRPKVLQQIIAVCGQSVSGAPELRAGFGVEHAGSARYVACDAASTGNRARSWCGASVPGFVCRLVVLLTQERIGPFAILGHSVDHGWHLGSGIPH